MMTFYNNLKFSGDTNVSGVFSCITTVYYLIFLLYFSISAYTPMDVILFNLIKVMRISGIYAYSSGLPT